MPSLPRKLTIGKISEIALLSLLLITCSVHGSFADDLDADQLLVSAINRYKSVESYTCRLDKRVAKAGKLYEDELLFSLGKGATQRP